MNPVLHIIEEHGLFSEEGIENFCFRSPEKVLVEVRDKIYEALKAADAEIERRLDPFSAFDFLASAALRGDNGCAYVGCQLEKIYALSRYAALYCDKVLFPLELEPRSGPDSGVDRRYALLRALIAVLELRPLVDSGIVVLLPGQLNFHFCPDCLPRIVPGAPDIIQTARALTKEHLNDFSLIYQRDEKGPGITIKGPTDYFEHGQMFMRLQKPPAWLPKGLTESVKVGAEIELPKNTIPDSHLVDHVFDEIGTDICLQQYYGMKYDTKYLTDRPGEAEFLKTLTKDDNLTARTAVLCARLSHNIPLLTDVSLPTLLKIRKDDYPAFQQYRAAITKIVQDHIRSGNAIGDNEAKDIYSDILEPEILRLESQARTHRAAAARRAMTKGLASTAVIGIGVFGGILPAQLAELCRTIGGVSLVREMAEALATLKEQPTEVRNHNLFFLLKVKQQLSN